MSLTYEDVVLIGKFECNKEELIKTLKNIIEDIHKKERNVKIAKVTGTTVEVVGSVTTVVGLALIPVTFGTSSILMATGGAVSALGTAVNCGTDITNFILDAKIHKIILKLANERNKILDECIQQINLIETDLFERLNPKDRSSFCFCVKGAYRAFTFGKNVCDVVNGIKAASLAIKLGNTATQVGKFGLMEASSVVGIVFTIIDVVVLVNEWNEVHPDLQFIDELINTLKNDTELFRLLFKLKTDPQYSQQYFKESFKKIPYKNDDEDDGIFSDNDK